MAAKIHNKLQNSLSARFFFWVTLSTLLLCFFITLRWSAFSLSPDRRKSAPRAGGIIRAALASNTNQITLPIYNIGNVYFAKVAIGSPPVAYYLAIDTATEISWVHCAPTKNYAPQTSPIFNPENSSTYEGITYGDPYCKTYFRRVKNRCTYTMDYSGPRKAMGVLSRDTITFAADSSSPAMSFRRFIFGCTNDDLGFNKIGGILGLNLGVLSVPSQLIGPTRGRFSYCFSKDRSAIGYLQFGDKARITGKGVVQTTPFIRNNRFENYYLNLSGISIGNDRVRLPSDSFSIDSYQKGGFIIDSATPYTRIVRSAYNVLVREFERYFERYNLKRYQGNMPNFDLCYKLSGHFDGFPSVSFHFQSANLVLTKNVFDEFELDGERVFCLLMMPDDEMSIFGAVQQQDIQFVYDLVNRRLSFANEDCS